MNNQLNPDPQGGESNMDILEISYCPSCGYTEADAKFNLDHHLCKNAGKAPWEVKAEGATTQPTPIDKRVVNPRLTAFQEYRRSKLPVPSAGSKPQEEGGTPAQVDAAGRELPPHCEFCGQWMFRKEVQVRYEANKASFSQPVADGGGLPPLPKERFWFTDAEVLSHLEVSEYQETQIRGRLMHMTTGEKYALYRAVIDTAKRKGFVSLLSPEGSSR